MDVDAINNWSERWRMPLNHSKCVHITFVRESTYTYGFNTPDEFAPIPTKDGIKDLGVTFTSNLKFSRHHDVTTPKATQLPRSSDEHSKIPDRLSHTLQHLYKAHTRIRSLSYIYQLCWWWKSARDGSAGRHETSLWATTSTILNRMEILNLYPLDVRKLRGDLILLYSLFESARLHSFRFSNDRPPPWPWKKTFQTASHFFHPLNFTPVT